jgi:putative ABC transport system permease protein
MQSPGDIFGEVFRAIWAHKLRAFLTMFGIAWGVGSLLLLIGFGEGFRSGQHRQMASLGNNVIMMWGGNIPAVPSQHTGMRPYKLTLADEAAIRADAPRVRNITAMLQNTTIKEVSDESSSSGEVTGVEPNYSEVRFVPVAEGRFIRSDDLEQRRRVVVMGKKTAALLFPGRPSLGEWILLNGTRFQVIGVAGSIARGNNDSDNQRVYIPLTTMLELYPLTGENVPRDALSSLQYQPIAREDDLPAMVEVHAIVAKQHGFDVNAPDAFEEWDSINSQRLVGKIFDAMDLFLGGVGIVTLALGALGVVNIMLVSVAERTREIGLRKALGATKRNIMTQFLLEGMFLTGISGGVGVAAAGLLMFVLNRAMGDSVPGFDAPRLVPWSAALALGALCLSGIIAGVYPAGQAARLDPVEALRRE